MSLEQLFKDNYSYKIAKQLGVAINTQLPPSVDLSLFCETPLIDPGEKVYSFQSYDTDTGEVLAVNSSTGAITVVKRSPVSDTEVSFSGFQSKLEYILIDAILDASDQEILARKKDIMIDNLDKREIKLVIDAIMSASSGSFGASYIQTVTLDSGEDLYDVILQAFHKLEDYGDGFVLLAGTTVKERIDTWNKDQAGTLNYKNDIYEVLQRKNCKLVKVFGQVVTSDGGSLTNLMDKESFILIATNSRIAQGKPIHFARRRIKPELAQLIGASREANNDYRIFLSHPTPVQSSGDNLGAYGIWAYEKNAVVITNPKMICYGSDVVS